MDRWIDVASPYNGILFSNKKEWRIDTLQHEWTLKTSSSVQFSCSVMSDSLWPPGLQHARLPCPSPTPRAYSNSCPLSRWCHPTISSSVVPFSSLLQSFPASGSFPMSQFFALGGGQSIGVSASASVLSMNIQDWFPSGLTGLISLQSKGFSRVFSNTTVQKHQWWFWKHYAKWKKPDTKGHILYDSIFMKCPGQTNL